jgi:hypothetical protein
VKECKECGEQFSSAEVIGGFLFERLRCPICDAWIGEGEEN